MKTMILAHRGASAYAPENTMEAFQLAKKMGADGIELDVHLTKDGHLVVAHDETIDRCSNGSGRIIDKTLDELLEYDFSAGSVNFFNVRIPTLEQVLLYAKRTGLVVNIEIKSNIIMYEKIEEKTVRLVSKMGLMDRVIYSSFNHYSLMRIRQFDPDAKIGILYSEVLVSPCAYAIHMKATAIHPFYPTLKIFGPIDECKKAGIKIHTWTVNNTEDMLWLFKENIDAIITNHPDEAVKLRSKIQK